MGRDDSPGAAKCHDDGAEQEEAKRKKHHLETITSTTTPPDSGTDPARRQKKKDPRAMAGWRPRKAATCLRAKKRSKRKQSRHDG
jgi:hypothetical protein